MKENTLGSGKEFVSAIEASIAEVEDTKNNPESKIQDRHIQNFIQNMTYRINQITTFNKRFTKTPKKLLERLNALTPSKS